MVSPTSSSVIDRVLVQWGDRLFYPGNRIVKGRWITTIIFAGGYSAGYYSYLWAEVLSADAWTMFEQAGALDVATGQRYRETILERGGSQPMSENFKAFVGRAPQIDALLRQRGMAIAN